MEIDDLLRQMSAAHASDLHLSADEAPVLRCDGMLQRLEMPSLSIDQLEIFLDRLLTQAQRQIFQTERELDFAIDAIDQRFRVNAFFNRKGPALVMRHIQAQPPNLKDLGGPEIISSLADLEKGLILVTGPTGSGKSSTLAGMIRHINETSARHVITIEDPIEFLHRSAQSLITQREVGRDTTSFRNALKSALREDPDVILVGELRDHETISLALTAAETGHLVFATLHTSSAHRALLRIIDAVPTGERDMARAMLSSSLQAVIAQALLPKIGGGRVAAYEILIGTHAVRHMIQENQPAQIYSAMQIGARYGMQTMSDAIAEHVKANLVDPVVADEILRSLGDTNHESDSFNKESEMSVFQDKKSLAVPNDTQKEGWSF